MTVDGSERRLIVNADDLGMSVGINQAIFELMELRLVTSATVLANGAAVDDAIRTAVTYPHSSFGVHLNVTDGPPIGSRDGVRVLLDKAGHFTTKIFDIQPSAALAKAVAQEWCAQVERLMSKGLPISHLDSHQHVHTIPRLFSAFKTVQRRFRIRRARLSKNLYCRELPAGSKMLLLKKRVWNAALRLYYPTKTTSWFTELYSLSRAAREQPLDPGAIEAMVHPGATTGQTMLDELQELRGGVLDTLPFRVRLISYNEL